MNRIELYFDHNIEYIYINWVQQIHNCDRGDPLETQRAYDEDHQDI